MKRNCGKNYNFFRVEKLREFLALELMPSDVLVDFDRIFDDFILFCIFCGNDFLPRLPSLNIHEGAIELLIHVYKRVLPNMGHMCEGSIVNLCAVEFFIHTTSKYDDAIFSKRTKL